MLAALHEADEDKSIRCIVLTGHGRAFCSGDDLKEQAEANKAGSRAHFGEFGRVLDRIETHGLPVIAAVNGHCLGGGLELASVCDIRIASTRASFVCSGVNVGLMASAYRLPRLIAFACAHPMLLNGLLHNATIARIRPVTAVHEPISLMPEADSSSPNASPAAPRSASSGQGSASLAPT